MGLLATSTIVLSTLMAVGLGVIALLVADRFHGRRRYRIGAVAVLVATAQLAAVLAAGLLVNAHFGLYTSWGELFGHTAVRSAPTQPVGVAVDSRFHDQLLASFQQGHGTVLPLTIPAPSVGLPPQPALIYLPAQYGNPLAPTARFPVIELMDGVPGHPETWTGPLHLQHILDSMINSLASSPFIAVMPTMTVIPGRDTECVNVWHGPAVDTYLTHDVRTAVVSMVRAQSEARGWGIMGYSTGGYCALNLAMRHPSSFAAAVSLSGYNRPYLDRSTGALFGHNAALQAANTPLWEAQHWSGASLNLLVVASRSDKPVYEQALQMREAARGQLRLTLVVVPHGGHNFGLWSRLEPLAYNWLSHQLNPALVTLGLHDGAPVPPTPTPSREARSHTHASTSSPPPRPHGTASTRTSASRSRSPQH